MQRTENPIVLRYDSTGHLTGKLDLITMLCIHRDAIEYWTDHKDALQILNRGHSYPLLDGSWLELENRHC